MKYYYDIVDQYIRKILYKNFRIIAHSRFLKVNRKSIIYISRAKFKDMKISRYFF